MAPRIRLHAILFLSFTLISSVPVLMLDSWVQQSALNKEIDAVKEKHLLVAHNLTGDLSGYATNVKSAFRLIALNLAQGKSIDGFPELLQTLNFHYISVINADGKVKRTVTPPSKSSEINIATATLKTLQTFLKQAEAQPTNIFFSDLVRGINNEPTLFVLQYLTNNQFAIGALSTQHFIEAQQKVTFGRRGHAAIVDRTGRAIAHPVAEWRESMKDMSFLPPVAMMMKGKTGVSKFFTPAMQADMVAGYTTVPDVGWGVMIPQPFEELEERAKDVKYVALAIALLGIGVAGFISWYLAGILARPIQAVVDSARGVPQGNPISHVSTPQRFIPPELRELMGSFNQMVDEIREKNSLMVETTTRLEEAQRIAHIGNWEWDVEQDNLWCSDEFYRICNIIPSEYKNNYQSLVNLVHPEERGLFERSIKRALNQDERFNIEHRILLSDGNERFVHHEGTMTTSKEDSPRRLVGIIHDITERKQYEDQLIKEANFDRLTDLPNRNLLLDRLKQTLLTAKRNNQMVGLLHINLDHFKDVNDTYGHISGDNLLIQAAKRLQSCLRQSDTIARLGGDEFTVILTNLSQEEVASVVASKIIANLEKPFLVDDYEVFIGASIGITIYPNDAVATNDVHDPVSMLRHADIALSRAKDLGRNTFCYFTPRMDQEVTNRMSLANDLRKAVEQNDFSVYYQPIVDLKTGHIVSAEALVRWFHSERGAVSPAQFIPLAEETGLIGPLGEEILKQACEQAGSWQNLTVSPPRVSVNLSVRQLKLGLSKETIIQTLNNSGLSPSRLTFEITESMIMTDTEESIKWMNSIRELGIDFSVDDFGTGYSSLSYLKRLPVDVLKIDRSFIKDLMTNPEDSSLIETIIAIGRSQRLRVVAEGVEEVNQLNFLHQLQCDSVQGYYYSKPLPAKEFAELLQSWNPNKARPHGVGNSDNAHKALALSG
jgi:diguanylate cyclase (GGDEF)-like protein